jgi:Ca2+-binding EF-hand superfamily protein
LPGIIGERFFAVMDLNGDGFVDLKEFVHGLFKIYYSPLETKLKLTYDMYKTITLSIFCRYDFDRDGFIKKEDVRLVLSHIPIEKTILGKAGLGEGRFTS